MKDPNTKTDNDSPIIDIQVTQSLDVIKARKKLLKLRDKKESLTVKFMRAWKTNLVPDVKKINFEQLKKAFQKIKNGEDKTYKGNKEAIKDARKTLRKKS